MSTNCRVVYLLILLFINIYIKDILHLILHAWCAFVLKLVLDHVPAFRFLIKKVIVSMRLEIKLAIYFKVIFS